MISGVILRRTWTHFMHLLKSNAQLLFGNFDMFHVFKEPPLPLFENAPENWAPKKWNPYDDITRCWTSKNFEISYPNLMEKSCESPPP